MKQRSALFWLAVLVWTLLLFVVSGPVQDDWTINLCAVSTAKAVQASVTTRHFFDTCASEPHGDSSARWYRLIGRRAMLRGEYDFGIAVFQRLVQLEPDEVFARFWLAQLYDRSLEPAQAIREYTWLASRLSSEQRSSTNIQWLEQRIKLNQNLNMLLSGQKLIEQGYVAEGIEVFSKLDSIDPGNTLTLYFLYRAYVQSGDYSLAHSLLPKLGFVTYSVDERWHQLLNDVVPDLAISLMTKGYWDDIQVANMAHFLAWRGDLGNSLRLLDLTSQLWSDKELLAATKLGIQGQKPTEARSDHECSLYDFVGSFSDGPQTLVQGESGVNDLLTEAVRTELNSGLATISFGPNLLKNGSFEYNDQGFPQSWFFTRSVVIDEETNEWETAPEFSPFAGADSMALCDGHRSARLQVLWDRSQGDRLFAAISQQVSLPEPGIYALGICSLYRMEHWLSVSFRTGKFY